MLAIIIISGVITPAFVWLWLYNRITDQYDEDEVLIETKAEAQADVLSKTIKSPIFYIYCLYTTACIVATVCVSNIFGIGDWYFSL